MWALLVQLPAAACSSSLPGRAALVPGMLIPAQPSGSGQGAACPWLLPDSFPSMLRAVAGLE